MIVKKYLKISGLLVGLILISLYIITLIPSDKPNRDNVVFVYDNLTNPLIRAIACRCRAPAESSNWEGYRLVDRRLVPHNSESVSGKLIKLTNQELKSLDKFKEIPKVYERKQVKIENERVSLYVLK